MTNFFKQLWQSITTLPKSRQIALAVIVGLVVAGITTMSMWGTKKTYTPLFEERPKIEDAAKVTSKLKELGIDFKLGKSSADILVPITDKSYILLQLAEEKCLPAAKVGWQKLIDEKNMFAGTTQQEFDLNYIRGLQTKLEETLCRLGPVKDANITIVKPKAEVFAEDQKAPSASLLLILKEGAVITKDQVRAIRELVCSAVEGLEPDNVRISDQDARDLTRLIEDEDVMTLDKVQTAQFKFQKQREKELKSKLQNLLEGTFGRGKARVVVCLDMDFDQKEAVSDVVIPPVEGSNTGIILSEKIDEERYQGKDLIEEGEPGVNSNLPPGAPSYPGSENSTFNKYERNGKIRNYEVTHSKEKFVKEQGTIRRLTASVVINANESEFANLIDKITENAKNAVGFDKLRGDKLSLMFMPFRNEEFENAKRALELKKQQEKQMFMIIVGLLMAFPILFGLAYIFVAVAKSRARAKEQERLEKAVSDAEAIRKQRNEKLMQQNEKKWNDWERRFKDVKNFFPDVSNLDEKKQRVQNLRLQAYEYAADNEGLPLDFEEMMPEEQFIYREAFQKKESGSLQDGLERLEGLVHERDKARSEELKRLNDQANERELLEQRVRQLVSTKPEDAVQVLRLWLSQN